MLTEAQYNKLTTEYAEFMQLISLGVVRHGVDDLIPFYEEVTGEKVNLNCSDCKFDMLVHLNKLSKEYVKPEDPAIKTKPKK